jgi:hypothetical protein
MFKPAILILLLLISTKNTPAQDSTKLFSYHFGPVFSYAGEKSPGFTLPFGAGLSMTATYNKYPTLRPVVELNAMGFPEFVLHLFNNSNDDDPHNGYGVYNLLIGAKLKLHKNIRVLFATGPSVNSIESRLQAGIKPGLELNTRKDNVLFNVYFLKVISSEISNGYTGMAILFRLR